MPWVRIDENAMEHPKVAGLSDGVFRLWVQGLAYCQKFLTDGLITDASMRGLRGFSGSKRDALCAAGLWERDELGMRVHDYLDWNESKAHVISARTQARDRMRKAREQREKFARTESEQNAHVLLGVGVLSSDTESSKTEGSLRETTLPQRAGAFSRWYAEKHSELFDVGYIGNPNKDYETALRLCAVFGDQELRDAAVVWFGMRDKFAVTGTRTIPKFASRASECVQASRDVSA